jgi:hypothetical protein
VRSQGLVLRAAKNAERSDAPLTPRPDEATVTAPATGGRQTTTGPTTRLRGLTPECIADARPSDVAGHQLDARVVRVLGDRRLHQTLAGLYLMPASTRSPVRSVLSSAPHRRIHWWVKPGSGFPHTEADRLLADVRF